MARIVDLESGIVRSVSSVYMRLITQSPHDESTVTKITFLGDREHALLTASKLVCKYFAASWAASNFIAS